MGASHSWVAYSETVASIISYGLLLAFSWVTSITIGFILPWEVECHLVNMLWSNKKTNKTPYFLQTVQAYTLFWDKINF